MSWSIEVRGTTTASPERMWEWYEATDRAPEWDRLIRGIDADGPIELGGGGRNRPRFGPAVPFTYTEVTRLSSYTDLISVPGAQMAWTHRLVPGPAGLEVIHGVECSGPLSGVYRLLSRRTFTAGMRDALDELLRRAEAGAP